MFHKAALLNLSCENPEINTVKWSLFWAVVERRKDGKTASFVLDRHMERLAKHKVSTAFIDVF